jgi:hypothetical protein
MNTKTLTLTLSGARPDNLPNMVKDEKRTITVKCGPIVGASTLSTLTIEDQPGNLTIGSASVVTPNATVSITASESGCYQLEVTATLANAEIYKGLVGLIVIEPDTPLTDYGA